MVCERRLELKFKRKERLVNRLNFSFVRLEPQNWLVCTYRLGGHHQLESIVIGLIAVEALSDSIGCSPKGG